MKIHAASPRARRLLALGALLAGGAGLAAAATLASLPLGTTLQDFFQPGTQPSTIFQPIQESVNCAVCHGGYDPDMEPYSHWSASMMAQSTRDPVFHAALAIANQDAANSGEMCLRCHAPGAWLEGRSTPPDGSGLDNSIGDYDGVTCHVCHRMVDPIFTAGVSPRVDKRILGLLDDVPFSIGGGQYVIDPNDVRRGPFYLTNFFLHEWVQSPFHRESLLCATCHDVSNPTLSRQPNGSYQLNATNAPHETQDKRDEFPIERTFSEWSKSDFAVRPIEMHGRFGGNLSAVSTCQDCHMPKTEGTACLPPLGGAYRSDLPQHDFNGSNSWVLDAVRSLYPDSETGLTSASVAGAHARNTAMMQNAADLRAFVQGTQLLVRIVNQSGHKLPTGYGEGRRMWINVRFFDAGSALVAERGAYDAATAVLTTNDTKVYEIVHGLDATQAAATGLPAGPSFHFVLNNAIEKDNRIPPRGFSAAGFADAQSQPVAAYYAEQRYWDDTAFTIPPGAVRADVDVYHQTSSKEYMDFLLAANTTNHASVVAYNQWVAHGKSAPVLMAGTTVDFLSSPCPPPIPFGLAKKLSNGRYPRLDSTGTPALSVNDFALTIASGIPNASGRMVSSPTTATTPFQGGTLYLGAPLTPVGTFQFAADGTVSIPILVTPTMVGTHRSYQAIFRDGQSPQPYGLSNALNVDFCP